MTDSGLTDTTILHLFGEGKHERIYDKLGAHAYAHGGAPGTRFAVWAPNAERVSVVGPFNHWNGDTHVMHARDSSGVWELAIPGIGPGTACKYEIRDCVPAGYSSRRIHTALQCSCARKTVP